MPSSKEKKSPPSESSWVDPTAAEALKWSDLPPQSEPAPAPAHDGLSTLDRALAELQAAPVPESSETDVVFGPPTEDRPPTMTPPIALTGLVRPTPEAPAEKETLVIGADDDAPVTPPASPDVQVAPPGPAAVPSGEASQTDLLLKVIDRLLALHQAPTVALAQAMSPEAPMQIPPEQGARSLVPYLNESAREQMMQVAHHEANDSFAAVFVGLANHYADQGRLAEFARNGEWSQALQHPQPAQQYGQNGGFLQPHAQAATLICERCRHPFRPNRQNLNQRFCCSACGNLAAGYTDEPLPHREGCTTPPGIELHRVLAAAQKATPQTIQ